MCIKLQMKTATMLLLCRIFAVLGVSSLNIVPEPAAVFGNTKTFTCIPSLTQNRIHTYILPLNKTIRTNMTTILETVHHLLFQRQCFCYHM
jgi:hypothetical protein